MPFSNQKLGIFSPEAIQFVLRRCLNSGEQVVLSYANAEGCFGFTAQVSNTGVNEISITKKPTRGEILNLNYKYGVQSWFVLNEDEKPWTRKWVETRGLMLSGQLPHFFSRARDGSTTRAVCVVVCTVEQSTTAVLWNICSEDTFLLGNVN